MARDNRKQDSSSRGKTKAQRHSARTEENKQRRINRQSALQDRPDSFLCAYALDMRHRRERNDTPEKRAAATARGEKQFTPKDLTEGA